MFPVLMLVSLSWVAINHAIGHVRAHDAPVVAFLLFQQPERQAASDAISPPPLFGLQIPVSLRSWIARLTVDWESASSRAIVRMAGQHLPSRSARIMQVHINRFDSVG